MIRVARWQRRLFIAASLVVILGTGQFFWQGQVSKRAPVLGVQDGKLRPCPDSPNCVSSQETAPQRRMEPLPFAGSASEALDALEAVVRTFPRAQVVEREETYMRVEFTSLIFGFVDDVEFLYAESERGIHFRSASRVGHSDLGVNRQRMQRFREEFERQRKAADG